MQSIVGTYDNGFLKLDKDYITKSPVKVIVTFLEDIESESENGLDMSDFSFSKSKKNLQNFNGSLANTLINERRSEV